MTRNMKIVVGVVVAFGTLFLIGAILCNIY